MLNVRCVLNFRNVQCCNFPACFRGRQPRSKRHCEAHCEAHIHVHIHVSGAGNCRVAVQIAALACVCMCRVINLCYALIVLVQVLRWLCHALLSGSAQALHWRRRLYIALRKYVARLPRSVLRVRGCALFLSCFSLLCALAACWVCTCLGDIPPSRISYVVMSCVILLRARYPPYCIP